MTRQPLPLAVESSDAVGFQILLLVSQVRVTCAVSECVYPVREIPTHPKADLRPLPVDRIPGTRVSIFD